ncbi:MAG: hypothetical protein ABI629_03765 [bacterium]
MNGRGIVLAARSAALVMVALAALGGVARAAEPLVVLSPQTSGTTTFCNTVCSTCTVASGECVDVREEDLAFCEPTSTGLPITACKWRLLLDGSAIGVNNQIRAADIAPNGNITFVELNDTSVPGIGTLNKTDIAVLNPSDRLRPFVGGGPYTAGSFKLYLNGQLTQQEEVSAKPWDALEILADGSCEDAISAATTAAHTCAVIGSLTAGSGSAGLDGVHFENEDLLRCTPDSFALTGTVESCEFDMFFEADQLNGGGAAGINSDIEALDFLNFDPLTMTGQMVFKRGGSGTPTGFPPHNPGKDLLLYTGTFGNGNCIPSGKPCAGIVDCLGTDTACNTGSCAIGAAPCASDGDCASGTCNRVRTPAGTVSLYFNGAAVGLTGSAQNIEAFALITESDGDLVPDGVDNCPSVANPPTVCSGPGPELCPSGLSSQCPSGETCTQADSDGDGVGDACDQCNGRNDAVCSCGDSIVDLPSEQCDLGAQNGVTGSPCSATCSIAGQCKGSNAPCTTAADCPLGQGCCGNEVVEANEACDDGNLINDDPCTAACDFNPLGTPIIGCDGLAGPHIVPAAIKKTKFQDKPDAPDFDRWKTKGQFILTQGLNFDPDTQPVNIIWNNNLSGVLFESQLDPTDCPSTSCFVQSGKPTKPKWKFSSKTADLVGAPTWHKGKLALKGPKPGTFNLDGRYQTLFTSAEAGAPPIMRQTIRVGDVCITGVISCVPASNGKSLKCALAP